MHLSIYLSIYLSILGYTLFVNVHVNSSCKQIVMPTNGPFVVFYNNNTTISANNGEKQEDKGTHIVLADILNSEIYI